jgi:two-component system response regulator CpxR
MSELSLNLLLVDDDQELCELLQEYLVAENFSMTVLHTGKNILEVLQKKMYDLVVLDVMLPDMDGFEVLKTIRHSKQIQSNIPVLMLTAKGEEIDRIIGLELGADDYLSKPVSPRELKARIKAILRRDARHESKSDESAELSTPNELTESSDIIEAGDLRLHGHSREAFQNNTLLELTSSEYNMLEVFLKNIGKIVSKKELTKKALHKDYARFDRSIDMHVSNLRNKIGLLSSGKPRIKTVRGIGYLYIKED